MDANGAMGSGLELVHAHDADTDARGGGASPIGTPISLVGAVATVHG